MPSHTTISALQAEHLVFRSAIIYPFERVPIGTCNYRTGLGMDTAQVVRYGVSVLLIKVWISV